MTIGVIDGLPDGRPALPAGRGTAALIAAIKGLGLAGRDVLMPVNLCPIAIAGALWAGVRPVLHDVDPGTGNARLADIAAAWRPDCAGLLVVHNFGMPVAADVIAAWASERGLKVIEDCCNAIGATWRGRSVGSFGDAAIYSFGRGKIADAGGGGAVSVADASDLAAIGEALDAMPEISGAARAAETAMEAALRDLRQREGAALSIQRSTYEAYRPFAASQLDAAGVARVNVAVAASPEGIARRRAMARQWARCLAGSAIVPVATPDGTVPWRFNALVEADRRDPLVGALRAADIPVSTWYPPVAGMFRDEVVATGDYPGAQQFFAQVMNLWVDEAVDEQAIEAAAAVIVAQMRGAA